VLEYRKQRCTAMICVFVGEAKWQVACVVVIMMTMFPQSMRAALPFFFERLEITRADAATHGRSFNDRELSTIEKNCSLEYCRVVVYD
jgi:hypothetical protein